MSHLQTRVGSSQRPGMDWRNYLQLVTWCSDQARRRRMIRHHAAGDSQTLNLNLWGCRPWTPKSTGSLIP